MTEFDIRAIADLCFVHQQTIRVWESKGWIPKAQRDLLNNRWWTKEQAEEIRKFSDKRYGTKR